MSPGRRARLVLRLVLVLVLAAAVGSCSSASQQPSSPQPGASCQAGYVALTFDDGPGPTTRALLAALKSVGVRATFFDIGSRISRYPDSAEPVSYTHLRAHETRHDIVCRLLLEKKKKQ